MELFLQNYDLLTGSFPQLTEWAINNLSSLNVPDKNWEDLIKVCLYFLGSPRPNLYLRQLPIQVHTKFVEDNTTVLQSLLDFLIPDHIRNQEQKRFAERYFLKHDEPLIRIRILDKKNSIHTDIRDISIQSSDFERTGWDVDHILIAENKMNFLTLPELSSAIAIWSGGGFNVSYLKSIAWLAHKNIYYWGDIDEHGFQILHQLRGYYPHAQSLMMDRATYDHFIVYATPGKLNPAERLRNLTAAETELYAFIKGKSGQNRLEQEKIPQYYIDEELKKIIV